MVSNDESDWSSDWMEDSSRNVIYGSIIDSDIGDNTDYIRTKLILPKEILDFKKITLQVLDYNFTPNNSKIRKGVKIYIYQDSFQIENDNKKKHNGEIICFGRLGDIKF